MDISIIILNYKSKGYALNCIKSILDADWSGLSREIIVVDNDSRDGIGAIAKERFPELVFIQSSRNLGMGGGNNIGLRAAKGKYLAVMNPDTVAFPDTFQRLFAFLESRPAVGVAGPKQLNPDRTVQETCFRWPGFFTPFFRRTPLGRLSFAQKDLDRYLMRDFGHDAEKDVDWLMGSFLFLRREACAAAGYFDERYFMYFEDTDLCRSLRRLGWRTVYYPSASIIHNHARQSAQVAWYRFFSDRLARHHFLSWIKYLLKWRFIINEKKCLT